jgi:hypothetical protein
VNESTTTNSDFAAFLHTTRRNRAVIDRLTRNALGFLFCLFITSGVAVVNLMVTVANYLSCKVSFELLGFEMGPLGKDELVGGFFGTFFHRAALAHLSALALAAVLAMSFFVVFKLLFRMIDLLKDRTLYLNAGDQQSARVAVQLITHEAMTMFVFLVPLVGAIVLDVFLFRYRSIAGALGIEEPAVTTQMFGWERQLQDNGDLFAWSFARLGPWGYLAVTALACLSLEYVWRRTVNYWRLLAEALGELVQPAATQQEQALFYGYDHNGQPVYDPNAPVAYDTDGNPVVSQETASVDESPGATDHHASTISQPETIPPAYGATNGNGAVDASLFDPASAHHNGTSPQGGANDTSPGVTSTNRVRAERSTAGASASPRTEDSDLRPVIGGSEGERVHLSAALADRQRYWVDPETHDVWDTNFRQALLNNGAPQATA